MSSLRPPALILLLVVCLLSILDRCSYSVNASDVQGRKLKTLQSHDLGALVGLGDPLKTLDPADPNTHLSHILIPRPCSYFAYALPFKALAKDSSLSAAGSANNTQVRQYIVNVLKNLHWHVEEDTFEENTPLGKKQFTNIIATWDPSAPRRFILSAHFDSKYYANPPDNQVRSFVISETPRTSFLRKIECP